MRWSARGRCSAGVGWGCGWGQRKRHGFWTNCEDVRVVEMGGGGVREARRRLTRGGCGERVSEEVGWAGEVRG